MYTRNVRKRGKMYCKNCGKEVDDGGDLCMECRTQDMPQAQRKKDINKTQKRVGIILIFAVLLIILVGVVISVVYINTPQYKYSYQLKSGDKNYAKGNYEVAISAYKAALEIKPSSYTAEEGLVSSYLQFADLYYQNGDYENAVNCYEQVLNIKKNRQAESGIVKAYFAWGKKQYAAGLYENAVESYEEVLKIESGNEEALQGIMESYLGIAEKKKEEGDYESSLNYYDKVLNKQSNNIQAIRGKTDVYLNLGKQKYESGQYDEAFEYYEIAMSIDYTRPEIYRGESDVLLKKDVTLAVEKLDEGIQNASETEELQIRKEYIIENTVVLQKNTYYEGNPQFKYEYTYDADGNVIKEIWDGGDFYSCYEATYDSHGNATEIKYYNRNNELENIYKTVYNEMDDVVSQIYCNAKGEMYLQYEYIYSAPGCVLYINKYNQELTAGVKNVEYSYDDMQHQVSKKIYNDDGSLWFSGNYEYDNNGNMIKEEGYYEDSEYVEKYVYNDQGQVIELHHGAHYYRGSYDTYYYTYEYDEQGNLIRENKIEPDFQICTEYTYDVFGNVLREDELIKRDYGRDSTSFSTTEYTYQYMGE